MRVFNIPSSAPFLRTLITALIDGDLVEGFSARNAPEKLATVTLYLPTRRAGRMAQEIFLDVLGTDAVLLPRIVPLGDVDEEELAFAQAAAPEALERLDEPPALDGLQRRLLLAQLIAAWAKQLAPGDSGQTPLVVGGPASTLALADDLARLMDDMATRKVDWSALDGLVPDALDQYWQLTLQFLSIARNVWPDILAAHTAIEPAMRRDLLIDAEAARLKAHKGGPIIAAGSTGSMPTTAKFLREVAQMPQGAVVLPGLDTDLDDTAWNLIGGTKDALGRAESSASNHPQFALHTLLERFGITRRDVMTLGTPSPQGRELLASEAMRPSNATAQWHTRLAQPAVEQKIAAGMQNLAVIAAANPEMEALAIAIAMREAHELKKSAALVTPDRALARRVMAALGRWNLVFDDSGGDALTETSAGIFARLIAEAAAEQLEPATLLALLKHPLFRLGAAPNTWKDAIETLELALLRGTRPTPGTAGLAQDFARFRDELGKLRRREASMLHGAEPRAKLNDDRLDRTEDLIAALRAALAPLESIHPIRPIDFAEVALRHREAIKFLSRDDRDSEAAFAGREGAALAKAFDDLVVMETIDAESGSEERLRPSGLMMQLRDYPDVFHTAFSDRIVRRPEVANASLRIYGQLEARLTQSDRVILGGLVEGIWPPSPRIDPWLSRPMRYQLGLDLPERRIGLTAHDFVQLLGTEDVILSHAAKVGGAPAVASRFLHRLEAVAGEARWEAALAAGEHYVRYAEELDRPEQVTPIAQPEPRPPRAARPLRLSVTAIEDWLRDPYTIYAKYILGLVPLDPVDMPLSAADRGSAIHASLGDFTMEYSKALPDDPAAALRRIGQTHFAPLMTRPEARALWWPRFLRIASWFGAWEIDRRINVASIDAEVRGEIAIPLDHGRVFHLSARADRIEHRSDRTFALLDYKTGQPPTGKQVRMGLSPQLTLEAAILREGGFKGIAAGSSVSELVYVRLSGNNPPGEERLLELKIERKDEAQLPDDAAIEARAKLEALIRTFEDEATAYTSLSLSMWSNRYGSYDDLARIKEWSANGGSGGGES
ncbi:DNA helicase/exodeoxyribonuclease V, subunit B [Bradyrhizobium sp. NFR13]|uniref:double-strand break repair protein AddB n=1 Tax=Bradyrhizobium sp. NFR13 TaxID=1566285 RepID=UPI0008EAA34C|nr:double-strand break repair protein AddB [Bradyrhizobium sp. NFR13]SFL39196.1 DNA helicase/exodeoxyribonuclease V, subunit B [Bradyrhizobium sp. NFR13]